MVLSGRVKGSVRLQSFGGRKRMSALVAVVVFRRLDGLRVVSGPVAGGVRPQVRFQSGVVLADALADRTHVRLDACLGQHVSAQRWHSRME